MGLIGGLLKFATKVVVATIKAVGGMVKSLVHNAAGVTLLGGATVGFTKIATELPFYAHLPLWIESTMVAPVVGLVVVFLLIQIMNLQMSMQGYRV